MFWTNLWLFAIALELSGIKDYLKKLSQKHSINDDE